MKFNRKWAIAAGIVLLLALPVVIKKIRGDSGIEVEVAKVAVQPIRPSILASGLLAYREEVNLTSEVLAKVAEILVAEGDTVEKGQVLLRLDPETYRNAIEREEANRRQSLISIERQRLAVALRQKQFTRSEQLLAQRMIDQARFDEERNQLELAKVELRSSEESLRRADTVLRDARELLEKTEIKAPIDGVVVALPIKVGETAIPSTNALMGAQLMKIADTSAIQAELKVDEADIARIVVGQSVELYAAAYPDDAIPGEISQIALAPTLEVGSQGRAYKVTALLAAPGDMKLRSGMSARADIFLGDGGEVLAVPVEAVLSEEGEDKKTVRHVWKRVDGLARKQEVEVGLSDDRWEEIVSGLKAGDEIVIGPGKVLRRIREGDRLSISDKPVKDAKSDKDGSDADTEASTADHEDGADAAA